MDMDDALSGWFERLGEPYGNRIGLADRRRHFHIVMAGLDPAIHVLCLLSKERRGCAGQARA
jgi:hypothetical protein